jgi:hypothetical protein
MRTWVRMFRQQVEYTDRRDNVGQVEVGSESATAREVACACRKPPLGVCALWLQAPARRVRIVAASPH